MSQVETFWLQRSHEYYYASDWFWNEINERLAKDKNVLGLVTGHTGRGKTCWAIKVAQRMDSNFNVGNIVFNYRQFRDAIESTHEQAWIVWDEPNKGLSHRDWFLDINKAITTYLQTFRFRHKNVLFALPKASLIDKSARVVCLFEAIMQHEGLAKIYQYEHNHFGSPEIYKWKRGEVQTTMPSEIMSSYYAKREEFHKEEFPEEKIQEEEKKPDESFERVYKQVQANRMKFSKDDRMARPKLNALLIAALSDPPCSDQTARKVITRIGYEDRARTSEQSTSATSTS